MFRRHGLSGTRPKDLSHRAARAKAVHKLKAIVTRRYKRRTSARLFADSPAKVDSLVQVLASYSSQVSPGCISAAARVRHCDPTARARPRAVPNGFAPLVWQQPEELTAALLH